MILKVKKKESKEKYKSGEKNILVVSSVYY
jgi:hypothetical protein